MDILNIPIFIICRDKVSDLKLLVEWFNKQGHRRIYLIDNDSSYPPLLDFYKTTDCKVIELGANLGAGSPWIRKVVQKLAADSYYIVSDPDVIPINNCPNNAIEYLYGLLQKYPQFQKAGFGLKIDDLPGRYQFHKEVVKWESQFYQKEIEPSVYEAFIDTTLALYRPNTNRGVGRPCIRTGHPYQARHMPWYSDSSNPDEEELYYRKHCGTSGEHGTWGRETLSPRLLHKISKLD